MRNILYISLLLIAGNISAQSLTQTIRGKIIDEQSEVPMEGVIVILNPNDSLNEQKMLAIEGGSFRFTDVPSGRHTLVFKMIGYNTVVQRNLELTSSKELVLNIRMTEQVEMTKALVVKANKNRGQTNNEMTSVSGRTLSIEESKRYAGSLNDVSRMAQNFAGVQGSDDSRNDIVVRGNSPIGVLYRIEGIDIPNPNHFAVEGTSGGPVSILNNNVLSNSDFLTGAFPAEYGNATSGVFDLKLRNGNNEKHEFLGQVGFNGAELMAEGPIMKKKGSSYLVSYRYSTLELFKAIGFEFGTASIPQYQDLSFKLNFPHKKGSTQVFGLGGLSYVEFLAKDTDSTDIFALGENFNTRFNSNIGLVGVGHTHFIGKDAFIKLNIGLSGHFSKGTNDSISSVDFTEVAYYRSNSLSAKQTFSGYYNKKVSAKHTFKAGIIIDRNIFALQDSALDPNVNQFVTLTDFDGDTWFIRPYAQWQYRPNNQWTINSGVYNQYYSFNGINSIEPRLGARYAINGLQTLSFGYGLHSILPPVDVYFQNVRVPSGGYVRPNNDVSYTKAHHFVIGYDRSLSEYTRLKTEVYYQAIFDAPVDVSLNSYSLLNQGASFGIGFPDTLVNNGSGTNVGLEVTFEQFLNKGLYYLATVSLYDSKYIGSNGVEFNTAFNGNYTFNFIGGKEFELNKKKKHRKRKTYLALDARVTWQGGSRYTPILVSESILAGRAVLDSEKAFTEKYKDYFRTDFKIGIKINGKRFTQEWAVDLQNVSDRQNIFRQQFNPKTGKIDPVYQIGFLPIVQYRILF